jgi:hypothetical protein
MRFSQSARANVSHILKLFLRDLLQLVIGENRDLVKMLLGVVVEMESTATNLLIHDVFWIMYWKPQ